MKGRKWMKKVYVAALCLLFILPFVMPNHSYAATSKELYGIALKTSTNVYASPKTTSSKLKSYPNGTILKYRGYSKSWYVAKIYIKGKAKTGYISTIDVETATSTPTTLNGVALKSPTKIYKSASTASTLKSYNQGTILKYESFTSKWFRAKVYIKGKATYGYISKSDVDTSTQNPVTKQGIGLSSPTKVYANASIASPLKSYPAGTLLKYQTFTSGWYKAKVYIKGKAVAGYIPTSDVENVVDKPTSLQMWASKRMVNVYSLASTTSPVLLSLNQDAPIDIKTFTSHWYQAQINVNGKRMTGYIRKDDVTNNPYLSLNLTKPANLSAQDIVNFFNRKNPISPLKNYAQVFIDVQNTYGVNATYLVAHTIWETGWGGSNLMIYKNNLYGYGAYDVCPFTCAFYYPTVKDSINAVAYNVRTNYLNSTGRYFDQAYGPSLLGMNQHYATDPNWKIGIANLMESIKAYDDTYYTKAKSLPVKGGYPGDFGRDIPSGKPTPSSIMINFPVGITGYTLENVNFRSLPYTSSSTLISSLAKSTSITVLGYNTDVKANGAYPYDARWYRVSVNGKNGWLYGKSIIINNLLQVQKVDSYLNIRSQPSDQNTDIIGKAAANSFLKAVTKDGKPVSQKGWYNVYLPNSTKTGWVSGDYIKVVTH
jgi:beta-N-acetylglucosaminidase